MNVELPALVGTPDTVPFAASVNPEGRDPEKSENVYGAVPPSAAIVVVGYGTFAIPFGSADCAIGSQQKLMSSVASVTVPWSAISRPDTVTPSSTVMLVSAIKVPMKLLRSPRIAAPFATQNTWLLLAPLISRIDEAGGVVSGSSTRKIHTASAFPSRVSESPIDDAQ